MNMDGEGTIEILLAEDNPADVRLTELVFKECRESIRLSVVLDGMECMNFLQKKRRICQRTQAEHHLTRP